MSLLCGKKIQNPAYRQAGAVALTCLPAGRGAKQAQRQR